MSNTLVMRLTMSVAEKVSAPLKRIQNASGLTSKALSRTQEQLLKLQNQKALVSSLEKQTQAWKQTGNQLKIHQAQLQSMQNAGTATQRQMSRQAELVEKTSRTYGRQTEQLAQLRTAATNSGVGKLSSEQDRLSQAIEKTTRQLEKQEAYLEKSAALNSQRNQGMMKAGAITATGAGLTAAGRSGLQKAASFGMLGLDFEYTMSRVQALTRLDKGSDQLKALEAQAEKLGADTMFSATETAQGQAFLAMAGFKPEDIMSAMPGMLDMALAGDMDLARTADIASNISSGFGIDPSEMSRVGDVLTMAFTSSNTSLESLGDTMKYMAPFAKELGVSMEESAAMAGLLGNIGIQGSQAGTAMRGMFARMAKLPAAAEKAVAALGVELKDAQGNMRNLPDLLVDISKATEGMGNMDRMKYITEIFGTESSSAVAELMNQATSGQMQEFIALIENSEGTAAKTAAAMADNMRGSIDELSSGWEGLRITFFKENSEWIREKIDQLTGLVGKIGEWAKENPCL